MPSTLSKHEGVRMQKGCRDQVCGAWDSSSIGGRVEGHMRIHQTHFEIRLSRLIFFHIRNSERHFCDPSQNKMTAYIRD